MMWTRLLAALRRAGDAGVTAVEMGLLIAGVALVAIPGIVVLNNALSGAYQSSNTGEGICYGTGCNAVNFADDGIPAVNALAFSPGYADITGFRNVAIATQQPTVTGAYGTLSFAISPSLPAGLSFSTTTGAISGTPTATQATATYTVTVNDSGGAISAQDSFTITVTVPPMVFSNGYTTINAVRNVLVPTQTPTVTGALGTKSYAISPALPPGMTFNTSSGAIGGTPTVVQSTTTHTVTVSDTGGAPQGQTTVQVTVTQIGFTTGYTAISTDRTVAITSQTPAVSGGSGTKTFSISPALPTGMSFSTTTGQISGTPSVTWPATLHTVTVTDTSGSATTTVSVTVGASVSFTSGYSAINVPKGTAVTTQTPTVTGGSGTKTFSISPALPTGMTFSTSNGVIGGTPTQVQDPSVTHTVTVTDSAGSTASTTISIKVTKVAFTSGYTAITAVKEVAITAQTPSVAGGDGTETFSISPALPAGLSFNTGTGRISGTPTAVQDPAVTHTVTVSDGTGSATTTVSVRVTKVTFTTGYSAITGVRNVAISAQTPVVAGGSGTATFSISPALPAGMSFSTSTGRISGTPTAVQDPAVTHTVTVSDTSGTDSATVSVRVTKIAFTTGYTAIKAQRNTAITSQTPVTSGGSGTKSYAISPALPAGMSFSLTTGAISGTPTATQAATTHTITATDTSGSDTATVSITVQSALTLSNYSGIDCYIPPTGKTPQCGSLTRNPTVSNGYAPRSFSVSPALPSGLSIASGTGVISGTPTATVNPAGSYTVTVTDSEGFTATGTISIRIRNN